MEDAGLSQAQTPRTHTKRRSLQLVLLFSSAAFLLFVVGAAFVLFATPIGQRMHREANEAKALSAMRQIYQAEIQYNVTYPAQGYACDLSALGGTGSSAKASAQSAQLLPDDIASGHKSGYTFALVNCVKVTANGQDMYTSYEAIAVPQIPRKTGNRGFCSDITGAIKADPQGGTDCTVPIQ
jgi:type IV pilus assembly protein PilA